MDRELSLHKAAVIVASLDADTADLLLAQMPEDEADAVRDQIIRLGKLNPAEQQAVIDEFFRIGPMTLQQDSFTTKLGGAGLMKELLSDDEYEDESSEAAETAAAATGNSLNRNPQQTNQPFSFLQNIEPETLVSLLEQEHPQAVALVLAHLPHDRAGHLLARLPATMQTDVVRRLVGLEETDPAIVRDVEKALEASIMERQPDRHHTVGMAAVTAILRASDHASRRQILNNLAVHDRPLAHRLTPPPPTQHFTFAEVCRFPSLALVRVVRAVDRRTAVLALAGAPAEIVEPLFDELRPEEVDWISHGMVHLGPLRLADFDRAQDDVAQFAEQLYAQGHLPGLGAEHLTAMA
jgi:flagellar motor switch protein FliG